MSTAPYAMRPYLEEDEHDVLALLRQVLGQGRAFERSEGFWRWKHFENPFGPSLILVAENAQILGLRAFMRWRFRVGRSTLHAVRAVDTVTHPATRRQGVFSALTRSALEQAQREGVNLIFNTPNEHSLPGYLKLGWIHVGRPQLLVKPLRPLSAIARVLRDHRQSEISTPSEPTTTARSLFTRSLHLGRLLRANEALLEDGITTARSEEYLRWRYAAIPSIRPYYVCSTGESPLKAAAIFRLGWRGRLVEAMITELLLSEGASAETPHLVRSLRQTVNADYAVAHASPGSIHWRALRAAGFIPVPRVGPHLVVRQLGDSPASLDPTLLGHWRLGMGDLELF